MRVPFPALALIAVLLVLDGCTVGPNFEKPAAPDAGAYAALPAATSSTPDVPGGTAQRFDNGLDIPAEWWDLFHSKPLDDLIARALKNNPDLKAAQAALAVAREDVLAQRGAYYPSVAGGLSASRQKTSAALSPVTYSSALYFSLYTPQVSVSFMPDVFGLNRRTVESLDAQAGQARFALIATDITLTSNAVAAAIEEASLRAQIDATRRLVAVDTKMLEILRNQYAKGYASKLAVAAQQSQLAQAAATLPPLLKQLVQQRDLLTALTGSFPDQDLPEQFELSRLQLPRDLPVSLPSRLVEQRPDIRQAEENLHAANAQIGIAIANRLPSITLTADAGATALSAGRIFAGDTAFWDLGAGLTQPIFDAGILRHKEKAARAAYEQAVQQYRATVIAAFQNVADTLKAIETDADALKAAATAADAAKATLDITERQVQGGYTDNLTLANAELAYQQSVIALVQAETNRYSDTAALFQALGGGWWNRAGLR